MASRTEAPKLRARSLKIRFMEKVEPEPTSGCWLWQAGARAHEGRVMEMRGYIRVDGTRPCGRKGSVMRSASRVAWELHRGAIPRGSYVLHKCDVPLCVNPDHLYLGTQSRNTRDMFERHRRASALSPEEVFEIRRDLAAGESQAILARKYDVDPSEISRINTGARWSWLTEPSLTVGG